MFKKFTDTLSGTLDTVKSYGSSMGIGQTNQPQDGTSAGKLSLNLPTLGNGSVSAPATTASTPDPNQKNSLATNTLLGIQNTLGRITGRGDSTNALVVASHQSNSGRGPALGRAVETNETRMTELHMLEDDQKVSGYHDITSYEQYKKVSDSGQMKVLDSQVDYGLPAPSSGMNGNTPRLVRSNTDEIIDEEFAAAKVNLDDVLDIVEYADETTPAVGKKDDDDKKPKKERNKCIAAIVNCVQDNRVKGGCVDPEEMVEAAEGHIVLKKVLNIVFLVVGTLLFLAVVAVIIVTAYVNPPSDGSDLMPTTDSYLNATLGFEDYQPPDSFEIEMEEIAKYSSGDVMIARFIKTNLDTLSKSDVYQ